MDKVKKVTTTFKILLFGILSTFICCNNPIGKQKGIASLNEEQRSAIDSILSKIDGCHYMFVGADSTKLVWIESHSGEESMTFYGKMCVYSVLSGLVDSTRVFLNQWIGGMLPGKDESMIYYLSYGGSGCFCMRSINSNE